MDEPGNVTRLRHNLSARRAGAIGDLGPLLNDESRRIAAPRMRRERQPRGPGAR